MNTFDIKELQRATVRLTLSPKGRTKCFGLVVAAPGGLTVLVMPAAVLDAHPTTLFVHCLNHTNRRLLLQIPVGRVGGDGSVRGNKLAALPIWASPAGVLASLDLIDGNADEPDDDELIVLSRESARILALEHAWYLRSARTHDAGLPVFESVPGKSQYANFQGIVTGAGTMTPRGDVCKLVGDAVSSAGFEAEAPATS